MEHNMTDVASSQKQMPMMKGNDDHMYGCDLHSDLYSVNMQTSQVADRDVSEEHESLVKGGFQLLISLPLAASPQLNIHILGNQLRRPAAITTTAQKETKRTPKGSRKEQHTWQSAPQACRHPNHCSKALFKSKTSILIQNRPYTGDLISETSGDRENAFLHCGDGLGNQKEQYQAGQHRIPMHSAGTCHLQLWASAKQLYQ